MIDHLDIMLKRRRAMVRRRRRQAGGDLVGALSTLEPVGKGAALGIARALGNRALKMGTKAAT